MEIQKKMESNLLKQGERLDDLQLGGLGLIQDPDKFCFGVDAVLLSDFAKVRQGETVLDMGTGNGIIPVLLAGKTEGKHFTGLEIQADTAEMAQRSVRYNHLEDRVEIVTGDIKEAATIFKPAFFDVITTNHLICWQSMDSGIQMTERRSQGMKSCVHWMIFCGRVCVFCRIRADFI